MNRLMTAVLATLLLVLAACTAETVSTPGTETDAPTTAPTSEPTDEPTEEPDDPTPGEAEVRIAASNYNPNRLTIDAGTTVVFTNDDTLPHTITHGTNGQVEDDPFVNEQISPGGTVRVTFDEAGTFAITCRLHPTMNMSISVEG